MATGVSLNDSGLLEYPFSTEQIGVAYMLEVTKYNCNDLPDLQPTKREDVQLRLQKINTALAEHRSGQADWEVMRKFFEQCTLANFSWHGFVLLIVRAHGTESGILLSNGNVVQYQKFVLALAQNASLYGKLKWLLFDACHGETQVAGQAVMKGSLPPTFHIEHDVIRVHPAPQSYIAYGTRFFDAFLATIDALEVDSIVFEKFLKKLARRVDGHCESVYCARGAQVKSVFKEVPYFWSSLIREFKLVVHQNGNAANVQCTSPWNVRLEDLQKHEAELNAIPSDLRTVQQWEELELIYAAQSNFCRERRLNKSSAK